MVDVSTYWNSDEFISELISRTPAAIFWKNREGIFLGCNQQFAHLAGSKSPGEIVGKPDSELLWEHNKVLEPRINAEKTITTPDGNKGHVLINEVPLYSREKEVVGILGIIQDITDRKEMESEQANRARQESIGTSNPEIEHEALLPMLSTYLRILLVEDNAIALKITENMLTQHNLSFQSAVNGEQAIALFKKEPFDLVLTDIGLPDLSGLDIARRIRRIEQEKKLAATPIIGLTAHSRHGTESEGLAAGMNQVLTKPIRPDMLKRLINDYHLSSDIQSGKESSLSSTAEPSLLDIQSGISSLGSEEILQGMLHLFLAESRKDFKTIQSAWKKRDFTTVQYLIHKMKSSAIYCGAVRMRYACEMLEHFKQQNNRVPEMLYKDFCQITEQTLAAVESWLKQKNS